MQLRHSLQQVIFYTIALNSTTEVGLGCPQGQELGSPPGAKVGAGLQCQERLLAPEGKE
jgi:hypothetical protein